MEKAMVSPTPQSSNPTSDKNDMQHGQAASPDGQSSEKPLGQVDLEEPISRPRPSGKNSSSFRSIEYMLQSTKCMTNRHLKRLTGGGIHGGRRSLYDAAFSRSDRPDGTFEEQQPIEPWAQDFMKLLLHDQRFSQLACKSSKLKKDLVDSVAIIERVEEILQELSINGLDNNRKSCEDEQAQINSGKGILFFDLCSGKGITTIMLSLRFPGSTVVGVDVRAPNPSELHLKDGVLPNLTRLTGDIYDDDMIRDVITHKTPPGGSCIILGTHLCGDLSRVCIDLMMDESNSNESVESNRVPAFPQIAAAIVAPCCLSRQKKPALLKSRPNNGWGYDTTQLARARGVPAFDLWLERLVERAPVPYPYKRLHVDTDMMSTKNSFIIVRRPPRSSQKSERDNGAEVLLCQQIKA